MADPKDVPLGSGGADKAKTAIATRSAAVNRAVSSSVRGEAAQARSENAGGKKGVTADQARKSGRVVDGVRTFGSPISKN
jgi:hypothetical protein